MLRRITQSPYLNLLSGLILLVTSGYEIFLSIDDATLGVRHGILVFSITQVIKAIPEIMHGLSEVQDAEDYVKEKASGR